MKDRYQDFIQSQQDPYEDEYEDDKDEYDEEIEDDEEEYEDEEEEVKPTVSKETPPASKPFGNGLNIQLGGLGGTSNNADRNQHNNKPNGKSAGYGYTPKQPFFQKPVVPQGGTPQKSSSPSPAPASSHPEPIEAKPVPQPTAAAVPVKETQPEPIDFSPIDSSEDEEDLRNSHPKKDGLLKFFRRHKKDVGEEIEESVSLAEAEEEEEEMKPRKKGFPVFFARKKKTESQDEDVDDEIIEKSKRRNLFSFLRWRRNKNFDEWVNQTEKTDETDGENEETPIPQKRALRLFSSLFNRFRNRIGKAETLDDFKKEIAETEDLPQAGSRKKLGKWRKIGISSGVACILLGLAYAGGEIFVKHNHKGDNKTAAVEEKATDDLAALKSKAEAELNENDFLTEDVLETAVDVTDAEQPANETENIDTLDDTMFEPSKEETVISDTQNEIPAEETADSNSIDFDFGEADSVAAAEIEEALAEEPAAEVALQGGDVSAEETAAETDPSADNSIAESLSVSTTRPAYGQEAPASSADSEPEKASAMDQIKSDLADTGKQIQSSIDAGLQKVDSSLSTAAQKTEEFLNNTGSQISSSLESANSQINSSISSSLQSTNSSLQSAGSSLQNTASSLGSSLQNTASDVQNSLSQEPRNEPLQITIGGAAAASSLSLAAADSNRTTGSSLGANAVSEFAPSATTENGSISQVSEQQNSVPLQTAQETPQQTIYSAEPSKASSADAAAVFNAEPDLSAIGNFDALPEGNAPTISPSLTPFGTSYTLPQETVPTLDKETIAATAAADAETQQLSSLTYNPANNSAASRYNNQNGAANGSQAGTGSTNQAGYREYQTKANDNLITIAEEQLGDGARWSEISKLNPNINLRGRLQSGIIILLPAATGGN